MSRAKEIEELSNSIEKQLEGLPLNLTTGVLFYSFLRALRQTDMSEDLIESVIEGIRKLKK